MRSRLKGSFLCYLGAFLFLLVLLFQPDLTRRLRERPSLDLHVFVDTSLSQRNKISQVKGALEELEEKEWLNLRFINSSGERFESVSKEVLSHLSPRSFSSIWRPAVLRRLRQGKHCLLISDFLFQDGDPFETNKTIFKLKNVSSSQPSFLEIRGDAQSLYLAETNEIFFRLHGLPPGQKAEIQSRFQKAQGGKEAWKKAVLTPNEENLYSLMLVPKTAEIHSLEILYKKNGKIYQDVKLYTVRGKRTFFHLYSFVADYEVHALKLILRKYSSFQFKAENHLHTKSKPDFSLSKKEAILILLGAHQAHVERALKSARTVLWLPLGRTRDEDQSLPIKHRGSLSKYLNFSYPFIDLEKNPHASKILWNEAFRPTQSVGYPHSPASRLFHQRGKHSAWFKEGRLIFLGLYPLFQRHTLGKEHYEMLLYEFLQYLSESKGKRSLFESESHNAFIGEKLDIKDFANRTLMREGKRWQENTLTLSGKAPRLERFSIREKDGTSWHYPLAVRLPPLEYFWKAEPTSKKEFNLKWEKIMEALRERYRAQPEEWVEIKSPLLPEKVVFLLTVILFSLGSFLKYREIR